MLVCLGITHLKIFKAPWSLRRSSHCDGSPFTTFRYPHPVVPNHFWSAATDAGPTRWLSGVTRPHRDGCIGCRCRSIWKVGQAECFPILFFGYFFWIISENWTVLGGINNPQKVEIRIIVNPSFHVSSLDSMISMVHSCSMDRFKGRHTTYGMPLTPTRCHCCRLRGSHGVGPVARGSVGRGVRLRRGLAADAVEIPGMGVAVAAGRCGGCTGHVGFGGKMLAAGWRMWRMWRMWFRDAVEELVVEGWSGMLGCCGKGETDDRMLLGTHYWYHWPCAEAFFDASCSRWEHWALCCGAGVWWDLRFLKVEIWMSVLTWKLLSFHSFSVLIR